MKSLKIFILNICYWDTQEYSYWRSWGRRQWVCDGKRPGHVHIHIQPTQPARNSFIWLEMIFFWTELGWAALCNRRNLSIFYYYLYYYMTDWLTCCCITNQCDHFLLLLWSHKAVWWLFFGEVRDTVRVWGCIIVKLFFYRLDDMVES